MWADRQTATGAGCPDVAEGEVVLIGALCDRHRPGGPPSSPITPPTTTGASLPCIVCVLARLELAEQWLVGYGACPKLQSPVALGADALACAGQG